MRVIFSAGKVRKTAHPDWWWQYNSSCLRVVQPDSRMAHPYDTHTSICTRGAMLPIAPLSWFADDKTVGKTISMIFLAQLFGYLFECGIVHIVKAETCCCRQSRGTTHDDGFCLLNLFFSISICVINSSILMRILISYLPSLFRLQKYEKYRCIRY